MSKKKLDGKGPRKRKKTTNFCFLVSHSTLIISIFWKQKPLIGHKRQEKIFPQAHNKMKTHASINFIKFKSSKQKG